MSSDLLSINEAAKKIRLSVCTVRRLTKRREIPFRKIGKRYFFTPQDIETFIEGCAVPIVKKGSKESK